MIQDSKIQQAVDAIIKATLAGRIDWRENLTNDFLMAGIGTKRSGHSFEGSFAGLSLKLYDKEARTLNMSKFFDTIGRYPLEDVNLEVYEQSSNQPWKIPYVPQLDELIQAVRSYCDRMPPAAVIDRIIAAASK